MLIEFRVKNFRSFRDEQTLSLVASKDDSLPGNTFRAGELNLVRSAAVYGPNASGKSNLIAAIETMQRIVTQSASWNPGDRIPVVPFRLDAQAEGKPSLFEAVLVLEGVRYQYGFAATRERIHEEWLYEIPGSRSREWFRRGLDPATNKATFSFPGGNLTGRKQGLADETIENRLFLSHAASRNHEQLTQVYTWFRSSLRALTRDVVLRPVTAEHAISEEGFLDTVKQALRDADFGISSVGVAERKSDSQAIPGDRAATSETGTVPTVAQRLATQVAEFLEHRLRYDIRVFHHSSAGGPDVGFPLSEESDGTQRFFELLGPWMEAMSLGYVVFVDELNASLHPLLVRKLVEFFQNPDLNRNGAQLVFTTHDVTLLDRSLLRRDQVWLTEKDEAGASRLYSLYDYKDKPRKDGDWRSNYLAGRYGAVPVLGDFEIR